MQVFLVGSEKLFYFCKNNVAAVQGHPRLFKVIQQRRLKQDAALSQEQPLDVGANRKRVCDFISVPQSNLGPILHPFGDIAGLVLLTRSLFHPNFRSTPYYLMNE